MRIMATFEEDPNGSKTCLLSRDKENLAVITDHGVIEKLARLANTENDLLRAKLAQAIGNCCEWAGNFGSFINLGIT